MSCDFSVDGSILTTVMWYYRSGTVDSIHGPTRNIWGSEHKYKLVSKAGTSHAPPVRNTGGDFFIPGGSSGGSAVSVASGCVFG